MATIWVVTWSWMNGDETYVKAAFETEADAHAYAQELEARRRESLTALGLRSEQGADVAEVELHPSGAG